MLLIQSNNKEVTPDTDPVEQQEVTHVTDPVEQQEVTPVTDPVEQQEVTHVTDPVEQQEVTPVTDPVEQQEVTHVTDPVEQQEVTHVTDPVEQQEVTHVTDPVEQQEVTHVTDPVEQQEVTPVTDPVEQQEVTPVTDPVEQQEVTHVTDPVEQQEVTPDTDPVEQQEVTENVVIDVCGKSFDEVLEILTTLGVSDKEAREQALFLISDNDRKGRKKRNTKAWQRNIAKKKKNCGQTYVNKKGNVIPEKVFQFDMEHNCRLKCYDKISPQEMFNIFNSFWALGSHDKQNLFIAGCVDESLVSGHFVRTSVRETSIDHVDEHAETGTAAAAEEETVIVEQSETRFSDQTESATTNLEEANVEQVEIGVEINGIKTKTRTAFTKEFSRKFYLQVSGQKVQICKKIFLTTLQVSDGRMNRVMLSKRSNNGIAMPDRRGQHPKKHVSDEKKEEVRRHILSYPSDESHYTRKKSTRKYISADLSVREMYNSYCKQCKSSNTEPAKEWLYRIIFDELGLSFKTPLVDTCKKCDIYKVKFEFEEDPIKKNLLKAEHDLHLRKADFARSEMDNNTASSKEEIQVTDVITFDLQKVFPIPKLSTNEVFYSRQLSTYNLGLRSLTSGCAIMNVWHEGEASRGPEEIGSCLLEYCKKRAEEGFRIITAFSDAAGGQNRNYKIAAFWMFITQTCEIEEVNHKFMQSGHSYLPNDRDFGTIEKKSRKVCNIYIPDHYYDLIEHCNRGKPFLMNKVGEKIKSIEPVVKSLTFRKTDTEKQQIRWLNIQWMKFTKRFPG